MQILAHCTWEAVLVRVYSAHPTSLHHLALPTVAEPERLGHGRLEIQGVFDSTGEYIVILGMFLFLTSFPCDSSYQYLSLRS